MTTTKKNKSKAMRVSVVLEPELVRRLDEHALADDRSRSKTVKRLLERALDSAAKATG